MAVVAVTADVARIAVAQIVADTGTWGNDGGGGTVADEPDIIYQAETAQSRKISTSRIGRNYTHGSGTDMTATDRRHYIAKIAVTNFAALLNRTAAAGGPAVGIKIGSGSSAYYEYYVYGSDNYPSRGGFQILAISPNVSGYRDVTSGSPTLTSVLYWSILADFSSSSKSENVVIDAIDVGAGLGLVGGDGADADGTFDDFVAFDEDTGDNRHGFVYTEGGVLFATGRLAIGQTGAGTSTATVFDDNGVTVVWNNGYVETGFHRCLIDLATTGTTVSVANCSFSSRGKQNNDADRGYTTTEDSRTVFEVTGSTGTLTATSCVFDNFSDFTLNSSCTLTNCVISNSGQIDTGTGANLDGLELTGSTVAADVAAILWTSATDPGTSGDLDNLSVTKGTNAHHAIEFGTSAPLDITLTNVDSSGFNASDGQNDSFFYVKRTSGKVTINVINGTGNFSVKSDGATVKVIINPVTVAINTIDIDGAVVGSCAVYLRTADASGPYPYEDSVTITAGGAVASVTHTAHGLKTDDKVLIENYSPAAGDNGIKTITVTGANTYTFASVQEEEGEASPANSTYVLIKGTTDAVTGISSILNDFPSSQNVTGWARKSTTSPYYKQATLNGTVSPTDGLTFLALMLLDE